MSKANWSSFSPAQQKAIILYHIVPQIVYSSMMNSGELDTLLAGNKIPVKSSSEGADVGSGPATGRFSLADNFISSGVFHRLAFVLVPPNLPARDATVEPVNVPAGSTTNSASGSSPTTGSNTNPTTGSPRSGAESLVAKGTALITGLLGIVAL
jgi:hypothetical protein